MSPAGRRKSNPRCNEPPPFWRQAHGRESQPAGTSPAGPQRVATAVEPEIAAVIAAAVSVVLNRPYRLVSVQQVATPVPHLNVWALEGRTQIFQSHKIR